MYGFQFLSRIGESHKIQLWNLLESECIIERGRIGKRNRRKERYMEEAITIKWTQTPSCRCAPARAL
ncbi:MAG: hypothetical protein KAR21_01615, partial [Spirochaetales bacterium]|nr:hypothetical protein [Spirochaetales bacterium]